MQRDFYSYIRCFSFLHFSFFQVNLLELQPIWRSKWKRIRLNISKLFSNLKLNSEDNINVGNPSHSFSKKKKISLVLVKTFFINIFNNEIICTSKITRNLSHSNQIDFNLQNSNTVTQYPTPPIFHTKH